MSRAYPHVYKVKFIKPKPPTSNPRYCLESRRNQQGYYCKLYDIKTLHWQFDYGNKLSKAGLVITNVLVETMISPIHKKSPRKPPLHKVYEASNHI